MRSMRAIDELTVKKTFMLSGGKVRENCCRVYQIPER